MKRINKALSLMLTAALSCVVLTGNALAADGDALWADLRETSGEVAAVIETNGVVTDGVIDVTFDADKLTYVGCDFEGENGAYTPYVAMYAVNDTQAEDGILKISWVAPDTYEASGDTTALFQVNFQGTGVSDKDVTVSGSASDAQDGSVVVGQQPTEPTPSTEPTAAPSTEPTTQPSANPSTNPSATPSGAPSTNPSANPSTIPGDDTSGGNTQTGDHANLTLYVGLVAVCVVVLAGAGIWNYKRRAAK